MTDDAKKPVTETAMRDVKEELAELKHKLEERNDRDSRQSKAIQALQSTKSGMGATLDFMDKYWLPFAVAGFAFILLGVFVFDGQKLYILVAIGLGCIKPLRKSVVDGLSGFYKARNGNGTSGPAGQ